MIDRKRIRTYLERLRRERYLVDSGRRETSRMADIREQFHDLFEPESIADARQRWEEADDPVSRRRARLFLNFMVRQRIGYEIRDLLDELDSYSLRARVDFEGESIPYRMAGARMATTTDRDRRLALGERLTDVARPLLEKGRRKWTRIYAVVEELGYENYANFCSEAGGLDLDLLRDTAERLLAETESRYRKELNDWTTELLDLDASDLHRFDLPALFRAARFDSLFPADKLVPSFTRTCAGFGVHLQDVPNVSLDLEPRPKKSPRAFCIPIVPPFEVHLVVKPNGGPDDYAVLLHEGGHALHYGLADEDLPLEDLYFPNPSIGEVTPFLLQNLVRSPEWLEAILDAEPDDGEAFCSFRSLLDLYLLRHYATKLLAELTGHANNSVDALDTAYRDLQKTHLGFDFPAGYSVRDIDEGIYSGHYLQAWLLEAQLRRHLETIGNRLWFTDPDAGAFLRRLWRNGLGYTPESLAAEWGDEGPDPAVLLAALET